ncbi:MAG TPA: PDDEXK nuclease domain-containing protein [Candidatus Nanoarchaeia archaeon]|nr:PDDEXK nuclease domain-containing protein [Candidatus Nanoarchaeia archaeon]
MATKDITIAPRYENLIENIGSLLERARGKAFIAINEILVETYWEIGRQIVEYEQEGHERAQYGTKLLEGVSADLRLRYGNRGFSERNLRKYRQFYSLYKIQPTLSAKLSWSHYVELLEVKENLARSFYEQQCLRERWSVRELKRQINSLLFERIALSKDKEGVLELSRKGHLVEKPADAIKDPYVLEFLDLEESPRYSENDVEEQIISKLKDFLLELGRDFLFVGRQKRITVGNRHYHIDLVLYHRLLKCFVLVDVKVGELTHADTGQMDFYLSYYKKEEQREGENEPIGLILCAAKNHEFAKYVLADKKNMFASEYKVKLPSENVLKEELKKLLE